MVKFLALQVRMGRIALEQVPEQYREAVKAELESQGGIVCK